MFGLPLLDFLVILAYFCMMIGIGFWAMRRIHNQEDYFLAGRRFGKFIQTFAAFGQATSSDTAVGVTTTTYTNGASGMWSSLVYLFSTPLYWMVMPWMRRLRLLTLGDFFVERYGSPSLGAVYAVIATVGMMSGLSIGFTAMTKTVFALTPKTVVELNATEKAEYSLAQELDHLKSFNFNKLTADQQRRLAELTQLNPRKYFSNLNEDMLVWSICLIVLIYAIAGGLEAAFLTDTVQGIFILILSVLFIPFSLAKINSLFGGTTIPDAFRTMHEQLSEFQFEIFGSPNSIDFTWYFILMLAIMGTLNVVIQPNSIVANGSARNEYAARFGFVTGCFMKRFVTVFWGFFALTALVLYQDQVSDPDLVWGFATRDLLGQLNIGLVGFMIAALMAALMSTADCLMLTCASLMTQNLYRPLVPNRSEKHYILAGRVLGGLYLIGAALISTQFDTIYQIMKFTWELNVTVAASFWLGMKWRRANATAAWWSILATTLLFFLLPLLLPAVFPGLNRHPALLISTRTAPIVKTYTARPRDIALREKQRSEWEALTDQQKSRVAPPQPLVSGEPFEKTFPVPDKSIYWTKGIKTDASGQKHGSGMLNLELLLLDWAGWDLTKNPYALNETIRIFIRTITPFLIFMLVALFSAPEVGERIDRFFVKMKTNVLADHAADAAELARSYADPHRFDHLKLFPNSAWEFDKWNLEDGLGFLVSVVGVFLVLALMQFLVRFGA